MLARHAVLCAVTAAFEICQVIIQGMEGSTARIAFCENWEAESFLPDAITCQSSQSQKAWRNS